MSLPAPLDSVARWLLRTEGVLAEEEGDPQDHGRAADEAREKQELLKVNIYCIQPLNYTTVILTNKHRFLREFPMLRIKITSAE